MGFMSFFGPEKPQTPPSGVRENLAFDKSAAPNSPHIGDMVEGEGEAAQSRAERIEFLNKRITEMETQLANGEQNDVIPRALESYRQELIDLENPPQ